MKKIVVVFCLVCIIFSLAQPSFAGSWWKKIIKRMMSEGIRRTDSSWDDLHAVKMAYDAYVMAPKVFSANIDFTDFDLYADIEDTSQVKEDVASGKYGPVSFEGDAVEIIMKSPSRSGRSSMINKKADSYKLQAMSRIAVYSERADKLKEDMKQDAEIDDLCGLSFESTAGVMSEKYEVIADGMALKIYMSELLALKNALTAEIALIGTANYANMLSDSLRGLIEIYDLVR